MPVPAGGFQYAGPCAAGWDSADSCGDGADSLCERQLLAGSCPAGLPPSRSPMTRLEGTDRQPHTLCCCIASCPSGCGTLLRQQASAASARPAALGATVTPGSTWLHSVVVRTLARCTPVTRSGLWLAAAAAGVLAEASRPELEAAAGLVGERCAARPQARCGS